uniref:Uncharacterized protein n=1 Tax=Triticum urartu TaxID=4572 RepID=A0A8R7QYL9_TRIUA
PPPPRPPAPGSAPACVHWFLKFACSPAGAPVGQTGDGAATHGTPEYRGGAPLGFVPRRGKRAGGHQPQAENSGTPKRVPLSHGLAPSTMTGAAGGCKDIILINCGFLHHQLLRCCQRCYFHQERTFYSSSSQWYDRDRH